MTKLGHFLDHSAPDYKVTTPRLIGMQDKKNRLIVNFNRPRPPWIGDARSGEKKDQIF